MIECVLIFALLVEKDSGVEVGKVAGRVAVVGCHLLVFGEGYRVVAHQKLHVGLAEGIVGGVLSGLADGIDVDQDSCYDCGHCDARPYDDFRVALHLFAEAGESVVSSFSANPSCVSFFSLRFSAINLPIFSWFMVSLPFI